MKLWHLLLVGGALAGAARGAVSVRETGDVVRVELDGALFTEYRFQNVARPFCYPVLGPSGASMTRDWPMVKTTNEPTDHLHHKGLWFAHGNVNGFDFWSEQKSFGRTLHRTFLKLTSGEREGSLRTLNEWVSPSGTVVCTDERLLRFRGDAEVREIDVAVTLMASHGAVSFEDTKEGSMAIRLPPSLSVGGTNRLGRIVTSRGARDGAAWGKPAEWVDYSGPVQGRTVGVAIFDHPGNPGYPTRWHARTYGLFAANPFGQRAFDGQAAGRGGLRLAPGERATFRYRFVFHTGDAEAARVAQRYEAYRNERAP